MHCIFCDCIHTTEIAEGEAQCDHCGNYFCTIFSKACSDCQKAMMEQIERHKGEG